MVKGAGLAVAALLVGLAAGYALGRNSSEPAPPRPTRAERRVRHSPAAAERPGPAAPAAKEESGDEPPPVPEPSLSLAELLAQAGKEPWSEGLVDALTDELLAAFAAGEGALLEAVRTFRTTDNPQLAEVLAVALGLTKHPEVERAALEMVNEPPKRLAALDLLDRLDAGTPAVTKALVRILGGEHDPEVLGAAVHALHRDALPPAEAGAVVGSLRTLSSNPDAEVRRRSAIALGEWARDEGELGGVVASLRDPSPLVRSGAAFALSQARVTTAAAAWGLAERVADRGEDRSVREQAWQALRAYPLADPRLYEILAGNRAELEAHGM